MTTLEKTICLGKRNAEFEVEIKGRTGEDDFDCFDIYKNGKELTGKRYDIVYKRIEQENWIPSLAEYLADKASYEDGNHEYDNTERA